MSFHALIVDDNRANVDALERALLLEGIEPSSVTTKDALYQAIESAEQIDVVFLDLNFGTVNGLDLIKELKNEPRFVPIPFVAYTVLLGEQKHALEAGFHSFLGKPLNLANFPGQIRRILNGERVWELNQ